ncbi:hypothetical protein EIN_205280 [Entamoeba invadens IP1]|uniref:Uncharacterized protein n=1 Tax=Entamoeba invadens IP1 TaxID=370355 RepID=A0A0A1U9F1_ENTIV|nr:hypothetical protein EIN_205280 [Entamoeba invadens IP1]ELP91611.1 hypothetical protein EIN_205280 [Entamoeba invadens IP1]|eukprot:XP_004258382.1 hypothetical protein EIN_205280 [Entamoeba invadens IP1]
MIFVKDVPLFKETYEQELRANPSDSDIRFAFNRCNMRIDNETRKYESLLTKIQECHAPRLVYLDAASKASNQSELSSRISLVKDEVTLLEKNNDLALDQLIAVRKAEKDLKLKAYPDKVKSIEAEFEEFKDKYNKRKFKKASKPVEAPKEVKKDEKKEEKVKKPKDEEKEAMKKVDKLRREELCGKWMKNTITEKQLKKIEKHADMKFQKVCDWQTQGDLDPFGFQMNTARLELFRADNGRVFGAFLKGINGGKVNFLFTIREDKVKFFDLKEGMEPFVFRYERPFKIIFGGKLQIGDLDVKISLVKSRYGFNIGSFEAKSVQLCYNYGDEENALYGADSCKGKVMYDLTPAQF